MKSQFNLLYPEWQGYGDHQEVYHGAHHFCNHVGKGLKFEEIDVPASEVLNHEGKIIGRTSLLRMMDQAKSILSQVNPSHTFMIGGTCACEVIPVSYLNQKYDGDLAVFWFDAHGDLNTPESSPSGRLHGMPLRSLLGEGDDQVIDRVSRILAPDQVALVGTRDLDEGEKLFIDENRIPIFRPSTKSHLNELIDFAGSAGYTRAYIHFDLDVLEPTEFPHVLVPVEEGLRIKQAVEGLSVIRKHFEIVGCSIVEYCPKNGGGSDDLRKIAVDGLGLEL